MSPQNAHRKCASGPEKSPFLANMRIQPATKVSTKSDGLDILEFFRATVGTKTTINHLAPPLPYRSIMFVQTHWRSMKKKRYTMIYISQHIWKTPDHIPPRQIILHLYDLWWFDFFALFVGLVLSPAECVSSGNSSDPSWFTENSIMDDPYPVIPNSNR